MRLQYIVWADVLSHLADLAIAYALAFPLGWEGERREHSAGLRTFPLVAGCGFVLVALAALGGGSDAQARALQGLITAVGFIAGGAVFKGSGAVHGTAIAASLWTTGMVGAAVGYGLYDIAAVLSAITYLTLRLLSPLKAGIGAEAEAQVLDAAAPRPGVRGAPGESGTDG